MTSAAPEPATDAQSASPPARPRILVTGSRTWTDWVTMRDALLHAHSRYPNAVLVHGAAYGADCLASAIWQHARGIAEAHSADWQMLGKRAGVIRNMEMVNSGVTLCLAFIRDSSPGASQCADYAESRGVETIRYTATSARAERVA
jgi:hypothetical protein